MTVYYQLFDTEKEMNEWVEKIQDQKESYFKVLATGTTEDRKQDYLYGVYTGDYRYACIYAGDDEDE